MINWKISTLEKKSIVETEYFLKDGDDNGVSHETGWRWGYVIVETPDDIDLRNLIDTQNSNGLSVYDMEYAVVDHSFDDGCWEDWDYDDLDSETIEAIEAAYEEDWNEGVENLGWRHDETIVMFNGPLEIIKEDEEGY